MTPDEVTKVRALYQRAKTEKKNIEHLEKAEAQLERKLYRRALLLFERIPADSEVLASPRAEKLRQDLLVNLRTQINHAMVADNKMCWRTTQHHEKSVRLGHYMDSTLGRGAVTIIPQ